MTVGIDVDRVIVQCLDSVQCPGMIKNYLLLLTQGSTPFGKGALISDRALISFSTYE